MALCRMIASEHSLFQSLTCLMPSGQFPADLEPTPFLSASLKCVELVFVEMMLLFVEELLFKSLRRHSELCSFCRACLSVQKTCVFFFCLLVLNCFFCNRMCIVTYKLEWRVVGMICIVTFHKWTSILHILKNWMTQLESLCVFSLSINSYYYKPGKTKTSMLRCHHHEWVLKIIIIIKQFTVPTFINVDYVFKKTWNFKEEIRKCESRYCNYKLWKSFSICNVCSLPDACHPVSSDAKPRRLIATNGVGLWEKCLNINPNFVE